MFNILNMHKLRPEPLNINETIKFKVLDIPFSVGAKYALDRAMINAFLYMREHNIA